MRFAQVGRTAVVTLALGLSGTSVLAGDLVSEGQLQIPGESINVADALVCLTDANSDDTQDSNSDHPLKTRRPLKSLSGQAPSAVTTNAGGNRTETQFQLCCHRRAAAMAAPPMYATNPQMMQMSSPQMMQMQSPQMPTARSYPPRSTYSVPTRGNARGVYVPQDGTAYGAPSAVPAPFSPPPGASAFTQAAAAPVASAPVAPAPLPPIDVAQLPAAAPLPPIVPAPSPAPAPVAGPVAATAGDVLLTNTEQGPIIYSINGTRYEMNPGFNQKLQNQSTWKVEFDRGNGTGMVNYTLTRGSYHFIVTDKGWDLYKQDDKPGAPTPIPGIENLARNP